MKLACLFLHIISSSVASATPITIPNASFESPFRPTLGHSNPDVIPGWTFDSSDGLAWGTETIADYFTSPGASSGSDFAFVDNNESDTTITIASAASLATIAASTQYTLTVAIGNVKGLDSAPDGAPGPVSISLLANGAPLATQEVPNGTVDNGTFEAFSLIYDSPDSGSVIGENLTIQLESMPQNYGLYMAAFDNVSLDAEQLAPVATPEPRGCVLGLVTLGALGLCLIRRHQIR